MPKKKRVKKTASKKSSGRMNLTGKINMVFRRLVFFLAFFVLFLVLYLVTSNEIWENFLGIISLLFGFISAALLLVLLILWFMKLNKKK